ncbi:hypothetical protein MTR67_001651 [Solanum verrucosum]|uniref:Reverse transcriptase domain-containing protein n=1 Tax=Solanum verrucosum TaxID=315347 RepID=A0AAF0PPF6_SOLVR|nr:hypothetical protein MTR67_001651 [Solanum verrucosum]
MMQAMPTMEELKQVVFAMNPNSAAGLDGFGGKFYQACWSIIKEDLLAAVQSFFCGNNMPKFMTHACLVLLPKNEQPIRFKDLRPISLSNFTNKIISKLLSIRLATFLPLLVSDNQSGFVRGRGITESIMLAQEITHGIKKPQIGNNVVLKLDMAKAYDRVSWSFICLVRRRFGFGELLIDLVWRIMSNNWYSIIINGHRHGFFHSTRGLKQGDPLSPALFILGAEVLSRLLNSLHQIPSYKGFYMEPKGPQINHLSFANDVIIFAAIDRQSLKLIIDSLGEYEHTSGQLINREKSHFMIPDNTHQDIIKIIQESLMWKYMMKHKIKVEEYIGWQINSGSCSFWWDDWLGGGAIANYTSSVSSLNNAIVAHFLVDRKWNERKLRQQGWDEVDHIFIQGDFASHIWKFFAGKNVAHTTIIKTLPIVICWNLWKNRCSAKYGGKLPGSWPEVVDCIANCNQDIRITLVMWKTPPTNKYKLNTDGSALHNPGKIGGGGILRDDQGVIIYAFVFPFGEGTNNQAEVQAACYGLNWCIQHGYNNILLEVDSELLTKWLLQVSIPWRMYRFIQELKTLANQLVCFECLHIYREANSTAGLLAKHSHQNDIEQHYYTPQQLPHAVK